MKAYVLIAISFAALIRGQPMEKNANPKLQKEQEESGFFIPMDTWQSFQNQLQLKTNPPPVTTEPSVIKLPGSPNSVDPGNGQVNLNQIPPTNNNPIILNPQPGSNNQPIVLQPGSFGVNQDPKGVPTVLFPSGTVQGNQPLVLVQQPLQNKPVLLPQQPNQPLYIQPGQTFVLQNGQDGKTQVLVAVPSNNQGGYTNVRPNQYQDPVYTLVLDPNSNGNMYLVPVQTGSSNPIILRAGN